MDQATDTQATDLDGSTVQPDAGDAQHTASTPRSEEGGGLREWLTSRNLLDNALAGVTTLGTYGLIALGFATSYGAIREIAKVKGKFTESMSHVVPLSFEGGIIILSLYAIRAAREGKRALMLEVLVGIGSVATLYVNWQAETEGAVGKLTHVVPVAMFLICFKYLVHSTRKRALEAAGVLPPPLPRLRGVEWALGPRDAYAQWRLMALNGIKSQDQAMWVHHAMQLRKVQLLKEHSVKRWYRVPLHVRLEMRAEVLAESEAAFATDDTPGRYTLLNSKMSKVNEPQPEPAARPRPAPSLPAQTAPRRELEIPDEQTALPVGTTVYSEPVPLTERPYGIEDQAAGGVSGSAFETGAEREERESRETAQRRQANYDRAVEVALELVHLGQPVTGSVIASDTRVSVGQRSAERYLKKMRQEGLLPADQ